MPTAVLERVWTDVDARAALTEVERALLPEHPAGDLDAELEQLLANDPLSSSTGSLECSNHSGHPFCCC